MLTGSDGYPDAALDVRLAEYRCGSALAVAIGILALSASTNRGLMTEVATKADLAARKPT